MKELAIVEKVNEIKTIESQVDMVVATKLLTQINKQNDKMEAEKNKVMRPLLDAVNAERKRWKPAADAMSKAIRGLKKKMSEYQTEQKRKEDEERDKIAARVKPGKGNLSMEKGLEKMDAVETVENAVHTDEGTAAFVTDYEITLVDYKQVPEEFLKIELRKADIKKAVKDGVIIPGLEVKEVQVPRNFR